MPPSRPHTEGCLCPTTSQTPPTAVPQQLSITYFTTLGVYCMYKTGRMMVRGAWHPVVEQTLVQNCPSQVNWFQLKPLSSPFSILTQLSANAAFVPISLCVEVCAKGGWMCCHRFTAWITYFLTNTECTSLGAFQHIDPIVEVNILPCCKSRVCFG